MPLSTSNSKVPAVRHIVLLLCVGVSFYVLLEVVTALYFGTISQLEKRRESEYRDALAVRSLKDRNGTSVLVIGNSLLLEGVNFPELQQAVDPKMQLHRVVVENTSYLDWYYGLRHMFRVGSHPDVVVLVLNPVQFTSSAIHGDYTAHFLVDGQDLVRFAGETGADRNQLSSLALAKLSFFYGTRAELRTWILHKIIPDMSGLKLAFASPKVLREERVTKRLLELRQICTQHGAELVVVLPPALQDSGVNVLLQAATANGIELLSPIAPGVLPPSDYSDNFHLNSRGAGKFTLALAAGLEQVLSQTAGPLETATFSRYAGGTQQKSNRTAIGDRSAKPLATTVVNLKAVQAK
jgi:hypothetical protein